MRKHSRHAVRFARWDVRLNAERPTKVNVETIHEATAPLASLLELKSIGDPVGAGNSAHKHELSYRKAATSKLAYHLQIMS